MLMCCSKSRKRAQMELGEPDAAAETCFRLKKHENQGNTKKHILNTCVFPMLGVQIPGYTYAFLDFQGNTHATLCIRPKTHTVILLTCAPGIS